MKKKVLFRGPALTQSGYGVHSRQILSWLIENSDIDLYVQVLPWGNTPWYTNPDAQNGLIGKIMSLTKPVDGIKFDVTFQLQLPNEWDPSLGNYNVGITAAVETDKCNPQWAECCNKMTEVITPSAHAKASLGNLQNIKVIPEAYSNSINEISENPEDIIELKTKFNFLVFGQLTGDNPYNDRKNTFLTLKWMFETFQDDDDVGIVLKTNAGSNSLIDRNNVTDIIKSVVRDTRKGPFPKVYLLHGDMSDLEIAKLYKQKNIKSLVSLTRGEGFGLPILEAAASDLPIITTDWSGHTEFLKLGKYIPVYYTLEKIHKSRVDNKIFMEDARWANASEQDFKKKVLKFRNKEEVPTQWAKALGETIRKEYSSDAINQKYNKEFNDLLRTQL